MAGSRRLWLFRVERRNGATRVIQVRWGVGFVLSFITAAQINIKVRKRRNKVNTQRLEIKHYHQKAAATAVLEWNLSWYPPKKTDRHTDRQTDREKRSSRKRLWFKSPRWRHHEYSNEFSFIGVAVGPPTLLSASSFEYCRFGIPLRWYFPIELLIVSCSLVGCATSLQPFLHFFQQFQMVVFTFSFLKQFLSLSLSLSLFFFFLFDFYRFIITYCHC